MKNAENIKKMVRDKYAGIVKAAAPSCCCSPADTASSCCGETDYSVFNDDYSKLEGYEAEADLNLGCGLPTQYAGIKSGDTVVDLGSGAGNDVFVARSIAGATGHVIGVDMTPAMVNKALLNNQKLGYKNVDFRMDEIEHMPVNDDRRGAALKHMEIKRPGFNPATASINISKSI